MQLFVHSPFISHHYHHIIIFVAVTVLISNAFFVMVHAGTAYQHLFDAAGKFCQS